MKPHILYIEDDVIDAMAFKRQMKNQNYFDYTILNNLDEIDKKIDYTLVISDANFKNGNYQDTIHFFSNQKIIIVSGTDLLANNNYFFFQKPFQCNLVLKSIYDLDFSKITEMSMGDVGFKAELTELTFSELEINYNILLKNIEIKNIIEVNFIAHKMKSIIHLLQLPCINDFECLEFITNITDNKEFKYSFSNISMYVHIALYQFKTLNTS